MVTRIAGGPYLTYGHSFVDEVHTLVSAGFLVFYTNPHGSQSFGQAFSSSVVGDWFGKDVADVLAGVEHMVSLGYVDPDRLGLVGASYGGTLINWIVGHDNRFAAAVSQRALGNMHSGFATSEWGWTNSMAFQFDGINAFDNPMHYLTRSPVWYVNDIETPILFLQAGQDTLTPVEQVEQLYVGLKLRNKETELVVYPEEQHYVRRYGKPSNRVDYSERVIAWLDRYMNGSQ
jgi:dipeptidyl aminopeptidase/acylaminoacyl peptidase